MQDPENLTRFAVACLPSMNLVDVELAVVIVAATYALPAPAYSTSLPPTPLDHQPPVPPADSFHGDPGRSSPIWEGQAVPGRPGTDVYVTGHAWTPNGRPLTASEAAVRVGPLQRHALVFGDRRWRTGMGVGVATQPEPFVRMPLVYERCFGGFIDGATGPSADAVERNPVGCGLYPSVAEAHDQPLANIEDPRAQVSSPRDRPLPQGFGPIARGWMPRRAFAGTYSQDWIEQRAPLWPADADPRLFTAASPGLQASGYLQGGEPIVLHGLHPDGAIACPLPRERLVAKFMFEDRTERVALELDAIMIDGDALTLTMVWRASVPTTPSFLALAGVVVRSLEAWELE